MWLRDMNRDEGQEIVELGKQIYVAGEAKGELCGDVEKR